MIRYWIEWSTRVKEFMNSKVEFVGLSMAKEFQKLSKTQTFLFGMAMGFMLGGVFMIVVIG